MSNLLPWQNKHEIKPVLAEKPKPEPDLSTPDVIYYSPISGTVSRDALYESDCPGVQQYILRSLKDQEADVHMRIINEQVQQNINLTNEVNALKKHIQAKEAEAEQHYKNYRPYPSVRAWKFTPRT